MIKWRAAGPLETIITSLKPSGMNKEQFNTLVNSDKVVLVDLYADQCVPCKKIEPYLKEITQDMADKVVVIRINADQNQALCEELKIDALPTL